MSRRSFSACAIWKRTLEDCAPKLETMSSCLDDWHTDLRDEVAEPGRGMDETNTKVAGVDSRPDHLFSAKSVVTGIITLITSILATGLVHVIFSIGR